MMEQCRQLLLAWYDENARELPWRGIHDPYRTWVSETMLQQTRVETVRGYYDRFLARFPSLAELASAPQDDVLKLWEGLGYYSRARNLHKGAQQVMNEFGGVLPRDVSELQRISGIGPYTAGAIASIAYDQPVPAVDGNVIRVTARLAGVRENVGVPSVRRKLEELAASLVPKTRPGDFNQALMDLGATVCVPGTPSCDCCPLQAVCDAYDAGDADELPILPRKNPPRQIAYDVMLIFSGQHVLMRQRTEKMLQGLWVFPMLEDYHTVRQMPSAVRRLTKLTVTNVRAEGEAKHVFTHQVWLMRLYAMDAAEAEAPAGWRFVTLEELDKLAVPTAVSAAARTVRRILTTKAESLPE
ncbi:MAG: A/G-specific adenine glycosylase [Clostridia bacterium]|nr:A/G-specific adenine glycosylase [Clostridia bacterium]